MGTWGTGPFDNDTAADFAFALDSAQPEEREALLRGALSRMAHATGEFWEAEEAIAAASVIAAQCPGGEAVDTTYGPAAAIPQLSADLPALAAAALGRILDETHLATYWLRPRDADRWLNTLTRLNEVLVTTPAPDNATPHGPAAHHTLPAQHKPPVSGTASEHTVRRPTQTHPAALGIPQGSTPHHGRRHR